MATPEEIKKETDVIEEPTEDTTALITELRKKAVGDKGIVTTEPTPLEKITAGLEEEKDITVAGIERRAGEEREDIIEREGLKITRQLESRRGFATNIGALKTIEDATDKQLKELSVRKEEAIKLADVKTLNRIAGLELDAIENKQKAQQQSFSNLMSLANFEAGLQRTGIDDARQEFNIATDSGAIVNMSDKDLTALADRMGSSLDSMKSMQKAVKDKQEAQVKKDAAAATRAQQNIDIQKGLADIKKRQFEIESGIVPAGVYLPTEINLRDINIPETVIPDLLDDISLDRASGFVDQQIINRIIPQYSELTNDQITSAVTGSPIPPQALTTESMFERTFGLTLTPERRAEVEAESEEKQKAFRERIETEGKGLLGGLETL